MSSLRLVLDFGHGGDDSGANGNGLKEKELTRKIGMKIKDLLSKYENVQIMLTRKEDETLSLKQRTDMANKWGADLFLSLHINAGGGVGYEDFIHDKLSDSSESAKHREIIHAEITKVLDFKNRGKKKANYHVLRESKMPAILTESGFIDNKEDAEKLKSDAYLNKIAKGHVNGLVKAFKLKLKESTIAYKIKLGDTLSRIATAHDLTINDIMKVNPSITNVNKIFAGQTIKIPK